MGNRQCVQIHFGATDAGDASHILPRLAFPSLSVSNLFCCACGRGAALLAQKKGRTRHADCVEDDLSTGSEVQRVLADIRT
jgi:hypothetical protein